MRTVGKLTALRVTKARKAGYIGDGGGLWLQTSRSGAKSWVFRYARGGRQHETGLGPVHTVSLAEARAAATKCRKWLLDLRDPIQMLRAERVKASYLAGATITFDEAASSYISVHAPSWRNPKHAQQWKNTLATYASPTIGTMPVSDIETSHVTKMLETIWLTKHETATRVRERVARILDWAKAKGYRSGDNPAKFDGHLAELLPKLDKIDRVRHHAALKYQAMGTFMQELRAQPGLAAKALEFCILTATRTSETIAAVWGEVDIEQAIFTIPAARMKSKRPHRVPLSPSAVELLKSLPAVSDYVFTGTKAGTHLSTASMAAVLKRMGRNSITVHGFRSSFRDWSAEQTNFPRAVCEASLAHSVAGQTEGAYLRSDFMVKRLLLMAQWAEYAGTVQRPADVLQLKPSHAKA